MKKITAIIVAAALIVIGCVFMAGCVQTPDQPSGATTPTQGPAVQQTADLKDKTPAYTVTVKTSGCDNFSTGDIFELQFPDNGGSTGYTWEVIEGKEILYKDFVDQPIAPVSRLLGGSQEIKPIQLDSELLSGSQEIKPIAIGSDKQQIDPILLTGSEDMPLYGASHTHYFWFQPSKAGDYKITLKYAQPWEHGDTCAVYSQTIHVVDSDEPSVDGAKTSYIFDSFEVNPAAGSVVKVIKKANPTTGYVWNVSGDGLIIDTDYKVDNTEPGFTGSPGQYEWYVTAEKPGDYVLKAEYKHAGSDEVLSTFEIPMKFVEASEPVVSPTAAPAAEDDAAYAVKVHLAGNTTYAAGSIFCITLPSNPTTGYDWEVIEGKEILRGEKPIYIPDQNDKHLDGVGGKDQFWFTPEKPGDYKITLKYMRPWEGEEKAAATYSQTIHVVAEKDPYQVNGPKTTYTYDSFRINPEAGEKVKISADIQLKTDGCSWTPVANKNLVIEQSQSEPNTWYVTAKKAGEYVFKAEYKKDGSKTAVSYFEIPLKFV